MVIKSKKEDEGLDYKAMEPSSKKLASPFEYGKSLINRVALSTTGLSLTKEKPFEQHQSPFDSSLQESLSNKHKDVSMDVAECPTETKILMKLIHAPNSIFFRSSSAFNSNRVTIIIRNTELIVSEKNSVAPLLILNYTQISKWTLIKEDCTITLHYSKSHYGGEFKKITLRTNKQNDKAALNAIANLLEYHVAQLAMHKGLASTMDKALLMFSPEISFVSRKK